MKDTKLKAHSCSALAVKKPKTQEKRRRRRQIKKLQWQLQWRGMGSKLEKGIEGKKMKDLEHLSQSLGTESKTHFSHLLLPFLSLNQAFLWARWRQWRRYKGYQILGAKIPSEKKKKKEVREKHFVSVVGWTSALVH